MYLYIYVLIEPSSLHKTEAFLKAPSNDGETLHRQANGRAAVPNNSSQRK